MSRWSGVRPFSTAYVLWEPTGFCGVLSHFINFASVMFIYIQFRNRGIAGIVCSSICMVIPSASILICPIKLRKEISCIFVFITPAKRFPR